MPACIHEALSSSPNPTQKKKKFVYKARLQELKPIILATQEAEIQHHFMIKALKN
jgi:hypothetical protein